MVQAYHLANQNDYEHDDGVEDHDDEYYNEEVLVSRSPVMVQMMIAR